jgi:WD40 repeat protein
MKGSVVKFKKYFTVVALLVVLQLAAGCWCSKPNPADEHDLEGRQPLMQRRREMVLRTAVVQIEMQENPLQRVEQQRRAVPQGSIQLIGCDEDENNPEAGFVVTKDQAKTSGMLRRMLEICASEERVQLPNVRRKELGLLVEIMAFVDRAKTDQEKRELPAAVEGFIENITDRDDLIELLKANNFLLFDPACDVVVKKMLDRYGLELERLFSENPGCFEPKPLRLSQNQWQQLVDMGVDRLLGRQQIMKHAVLPTIWKISAVLDGHIRRLYPRRVPSVAITSDGLRIVAGSDDCTAQVWDLRNGQWENDLLEGHTGCVCSVAIVSDGSRIVTGSDDCTARIWDLRNGRWESISLEGHTNLVCSVAIVPNGSRIVTGSDDNMVRVWNLRNGRWESVLLEGHTNRVNSVAIVSDGSRIVTGSNDRTVRIWNLKNGHWESILLERNIGLVCSVAIVPDGSQIVIGSYDRTVRVYDFKKKPWENLSFLKGHTDSVCSVAIVPNGSRIVTGSDDRTVRIWDLKNGQWKNVFLKGRCKGLLSVAITPSGSRIVTGANDPAAQILDFVSGESTWPEVPPHYHFPTLEQALFAQYIMHRPETLDIRDGNSPEERERNKHYRRILTVLAHEQPEVAAIVRQRLIIDGDPQ